MLTNLIPWNVTTVEEIHCEDIITNNTRFVAKNGLKLTETGFENEQPCLIHI